MPTEAPRTPVEQRDELLASLDPIIDRVTDKDVYAQAVANIAAAARDLDMIAASRAPAVPIDTARIAKAVWDAVAEAGGTTVQSDAAVHALTAELQT